MQVESADVIVVGAGLAGLVAAGECCRRVRRVLLVDRAGRQQIGGLAALSFGGILLVDTPEQRRSGIRDGAELAWRDWCSYAEFSTQDHWPRQWARHYCENSSSEIYQWLKQRGVRFLPVVNWPERGFLVRGNSVPRWHITWGTGRALVAAVLAHLPGHLEMRFDIEVRQFLCEAGRVAGVAGLAGGRDWQARAEAVVVASGGVCGGDLSRVRGLWPEAWGSAPTTLLNGSHPFADGQLHDAAESLGARITYPGRAWHYAAGVAHPRPTMANHGLSLVPPRSALWLDLQGRRFGPRPLIGSSETSHLVDTIARSPHGCSWLLLNRRIALRELAVSGAEFMTAYAEKQRLKLLWHLVFGNRELVDRLNRECPDFLSAPTLESLMDAMQSRLPAMVTIDREQLSSTVHAYDEEIRRGKRLAVDEQLVWLHQLRLYRGDRLRLASPHPLLDPKSGPLMAIFCHLLTRKSLGGIQTDLQSRVLDGTGQPIAGLFAVGEAAGFGGGGIHGRRSLEGSFLGSCILTGRAAARSLGGS